MRSPREDLTDSSASWPSLDEAATKFDAQYPEFQTTRHLDELRTRDYGRLDALGQTYLDFTGGGCTRSRNSVSIWRCCKARCWAIHIREFARARGATVIYAPVLPPDLWIGAGKLQGYLEQARPDGHHLFAYPAQSNFSGVQHALEWIARAQGKGWDVLLDAAAFVPSSRLDLSRWPPDFVTVSIYKIFGYPTGVGCLLARQEGLRKLHRPWFAGGTIEVATVQGHRYYLHEGAEVFEDGTLHYLALPAVEIGLRHIEGAGIEAIHTRVRTLTAWFLQALATWHHSNGTSVVHVYGPLTTEARGGTVALNFYDRDGQFIDHRLAGRLTLDEFRRCLDDKSTGAVRVSLGLVSTFADLFRFATFARRFIVVCVADLVAVK